MQVYINLYKRLLSFTLTVNEKINNVLYDLILKKIREKDKKTIIEYFNTYTEYYLQIGCGFNTLPHWLNSDIELKSDKTIYLNASEKFPFGHNTFQFIFSEHLIEHLDFLGVINLLTESYRTLRKGGIIRIATPSLNFLHDLYQNPYVENNRKYVEWSINQYQKYIAHSDYINPRINHIYVINNFHKAWDHQIVFTFETLKFLLETIGFKNVISCEIGKSKHNMLSGIERHSRIIPAQFNEMETMILEAEK